MGPVSSPETQQDVLDMSAHRIRRSTEVLGYLLVRHPQGDTPENLGLLRRQSTVPHPPTTLPPGILPLAPG